MGVGSRAPSLVFPLEYRQGGWMGGGGRATLFAPLLPAPHGSGVVAFVRRAVERGDPFSGVLGWPEHDDGS